MKAKFNKFTSTGDLEKMIFRIPKDISGFHQLESVFDNKPGFKKIDGWDFTLDEIKSMENFKVINKSGGRSKYKTPEGFITRIKKEF